MFLNVLNNIFFTFFAILVVSTVFLIILFKPLRFVKNAITVGVIIYNTFFYITFYIIFYIIVISTIFHKTVIFCSTISIIIYSTIIYNNVIFPVEVFSSLIYIIFFYTIFYKTIIFYSIISIVTYSTFIYSNVIFPVEVFFSLIYLIVKSFVGIFYKFVRTLIELMGETGYSANITDFIDIFFDFVFLIMSIFFNVLFKLSNILILYIILPVLISVAYFTWIERKLIATIQRRKGPNVVGIGGLLQPLCDGLKLFIKEMVIPRHSDRYIYIFAPIFSFALSLFNWVFIPFGFNLVTIDLNSSLLFVLAGTSLGVYGVLFAGWSSNSKYSLLGTIRATAQLISYELVMTFNILCVTLKTGSNNLISIVEYQQYNWNMFELLPIFLSSLVICLAETNRHPFDLAEAESELVSGFNVEYSGVGFVLFFLAEYANMLLMGAFMSILFLGGWLSPLNGLDSGGTGFWFSLKISFFIVLFVIMRTVLPRYRYDQLITIGWKYLLPLSFLYFIFLSFSNFILNGFTLHGCFYPVLLLVGAVITGLTLVIYYFINNNSGFLGFLLPVKL